MNPSRRIFVVGGRRLVIIFAAALTLAGCSCAPSAVPAPASPPQEPAAAVEAPPGPEFVDVAPEAGLQLVTVYGNRIKNHLLETTGGGVAVADFDDDGDEDIYLTTGQTADAWLSGRKPLANALYRNDGNGTFTDVAAAAGVDLHEWSNGAYFADFDNDGDKDLLVTAWGANSLFRNDGAGRFTDVTSRAGVGGDPGAWSSSAVFADFDNDGDLDLYVTNYCEYDLRDPPFGGAKMVWKGVVVPRGPHGLAGQADLLYRNDGDGTFTDVTREASNGGMSLPQYGLGAVAADFDDDGDLDLYVANDSRPNKLWRNDGGMRFTEVSAMSGVATNEDSREQAGMGTDVGDYNDDGRPDLVVTNFSHDWNTLYRNEGELFFVDATFESGLRDTYLSLGWGVRFFDYDNDGRLDLFMANGHIYQELDEQPQLNTSYRQSNLLYRNAGGARFSDRTLVSGPGLRIVQSSRGVAVFDYERDGDLDVLVTNIDAPANLLRNGGTSDGWVSFLLRGTESNRDAIGARLWLETGGRRLPGEVDPFGSYQSQSSYAVHFGLGSNESIERLLLRWPSGREEEIVDLTARRFYTIEEGHGVTGVREAGP